MADPYESFSTKVEVSDPYASFSTPVAKKETDAEFVMRTTPELVTPPPDPSYLYQRTGGVLDLRGDPGFQTAGRGIAPLQAVEGLNPELQAAGVRLAGVVPGAVMGAEIGASGGPFGSLIGAGLGGMFGAMGTSQTAQDITPRVETPGEELANVLVSGLPVPLRAATVPGQILKDAVYGGTVGEAQLVSQNLLEGKGLPDTKEQLARIGLGSLIGGATGAVSAPKLAAPKVPKSTQIMMDAKTPDSLANIATEVGTQTENSPFALQAALNKMTAAPEKQPNALPQIKSAEESAAILAGGPQVKSAEESAAALLAAEKAKLEGTVGGAMTRNQLGFGDNIQLEGTPLQKRATILETRPGEAAAEKVKLAKLDPITGKPLAPAIFVGIQENLPGKPPFEIYNLTEDIPGHPAGSTVVRQTLEAEGFVLPPHAPDASTPPALSSQAQRMMDEHGAISSNLLLRATPPVVGGVGGSAYGATIGDTPEERARNAVKYGLQGAAAGLVIGSGSVIAKNIFSGGAKQAAKNFLTRAAHGQEMPEWWLNLREQPGLQTFRTKLIDARARVKDIVSKASGTDPAQMEFNVPEVANPYSRGKLYAGVRDAELGEAKKAQRDAQEIIAQAAKDSGEPEKFLQGFNLWLEARHTPAYNSASKANGGSQHRFSDQQAADIIQDIGQNTVYEPIYEDLADKIVYPLVEDIRGRMEQHGVWDPQTISNWRKSMPFYVPFNREISDDVVQTGFAGPGLNVVGRGVYKVKGSDLPVADIVGNLFSNQNSAIVRGLKNDVDMSAVRLFRDVMGNNYPGISVRNVNGVERFDPDTQLRAYQQGKPVVVDFKDPLTAQAFSGLNIERLPTIMRMMSNLTRGYSALVTRFSLPFLMANPVRDRMEAAGNLASQGDYVGAAKMLSPNPKKLIVEDFKPVFDYITERKTPEADDFKLMVGSGALPSGWAGSTRKEIMDQMAKLGTANKGQLTATKTKEVVTKVFEFMSDLSEGSTRYRAWHRAKEQGATDQEAALAARNLMDFNQKGTVTPQLNSIYAFFNPAVQGATNITKAAARNPDAIVALAGGMFALDHGIDLWNSQFDPEWKSKLDYNRRVGLPIIYGKDEANKEWKVFTLPVAISHRPLKAMVDMMQDYHSGDLKNEHDVEHGAARVLMTAADSLNPLGENDPRTAFLPSVTRPLAEVALNKDYRGQPIAPESQPDVKEFAKRWAGSRNSLTGRVAEDFSDFLINRLGLSISPEKMAYLAKQYSGGPGRAVAGGVNFADNPSAAQFPLTQPFFRRISEERFQAHRPDIEAAKESLSEQHTQQAMSRLQADRFFNAMKAAVPEEKQGDFIRAKVQDGSIPVQDQTFLNRFLNRALDTKLGREAGDAVIEGLSVNDGSRAKFYASYLDTLDDKDRAVYITQQRKKGFLNPQVESQVVAIKRATGQ